MSSQSVSDETLVKRLSKHPVLRQRLVSILQAVEAEEGGIKRADEMEDWLVEELRRLGQEVMHSWAQGQVEQSEQEIRRYGCVHREGKKNSTGTPPLVSSA